MTEAQVLALIQLAIIANGNNEITANVLRPVLEAMLAQPNDLIGDLGDLQTTANTNLVEAINEVLGLTGSGVTILTGVTDPNITPPPVVSIGDFYIWDDGSLQGFYQYNGVDFVLIKTLDIANDLISTDVGQQLTTGTDGKLFVNGNPIPIQNVYDDINSPIVGLLDNQIEQTTGFIQKVLDASADPAVTIPVGGTTIRYYEKLATNTASLSDYQLLNTEYYIIYEIQGETIINEIFNDSSAGTASTYGNVTGAIDGVNTFFKVSQDEYKSGSLRVFRNGKGQVLGSAEDFVEFTPSGGTFEFNTAPLVGDVIDVSYVKEDITVGGQVLINHIISRNTTTATIDTSAYQWNGNTDSGAFTYTLPAGVNNAFYKIVNTGTSANTLTVSPNGAELLFGVNSNFDLADGESIIIGYNSIDGWY